MISWILLTVIVLSSSVVCRGIVDKEPGNMTISSKKGVCIAPEYFRCEDVAAMTGVSWYYNWGPHPSDQDHPECHGHPPPQS